MSFRLALHCTSTRRESLVISSRYLQLHFMGQEQTYPSPFAPTNRDDDPVLELQGNTVDRKFQVLDGCIKALREPYFVFSLVSFT